MTAYASTPYGSISPESATGGANPIEFPDPQPYGGSVYGSLGLKVGGNVARADVAVSATSSGTAGNVGEASVSVRADAVAQMLEAGIATASIGAQVSASGELLVLGEVVGDVAFAVNGSGSLLVSVSAKAGMSISASGVSGTIGNGSVLVDLSVLASLIHGEFGAARASFGGLSVSASGEPVPAASAVVPGLVVDAYGYHGGRGSVHAGFSATASAYGASDGIGSASASIRASVSASGVSGTVGKASFRLRPRLSGEGVSPLSGDVGVRFPVSAFGSGVNGVVGSASAVIRSAKAVASGVGGESGAAQVTIEVVASASGGAVVTGTCETVAAVTVTASGSHGKAAAKPSSMPMGSAWSVNTENFAITQYLNYEFDHLGAAGGFLYGVMGNGIYVLDADTDDGKPIGMVAITGETDFDEDRMKAIPVVHGDIQGRSAVVVRLDGVERVSDFSAQGRSKFGRGLRGSVVSIGVVNRQGSAVSVNAIDPQIQVLKKRAR